MQTREKNHKGFNYSIELAGESGTFGGSAWIRNVPLNDGSFQDISIELTVTFGTLNEAEKVLVREVEQYIEVNLV